MSNIGCLLLTPDTFFLIVNKVIVFEGLTGLAKKCQLFRVCLHAFGTLL